MEQQIREEHIREDIDNKIISLGSLNTYVNNFFDNEITKISNMSEGDDKKKAMTNANEIIFQIMLFYYTDPSLTYDNKVRLHDIYNSYNEKLIRLTRNKGGNRKKYTIKKNKLRIKKNKHKRKSRK